MILVVSIQMIWADHVPLDIIGSVSNICDTSYIYLFTIVYICIMLYIFLRSTLLLYYNDM